MSNLRSLVSISTLMPWTKRLMFCRKHIQIHFLVWRILYFYSNFTEVWSKWQLVSVGSGNGLVLNGHHTITWTNDDPVHWCKYASSSHNELRDAVLKAHHTLQPTLTASEFLFLKANLDNQLITTAFQATRPLSYWLQMYHQMPQIQNPISV